jgi:hypothetical protein
LGLGFSWGFFFFGFFSFVSWLWLLLCILPVYLEALYAF